MALAETAQLAVRLSLSETGFSAATAKVQGLQAAATGGVTTFGRLGSAASSAGSVIGGALSHAKNQLGGLISGPLGIVAATGGVYGLTKAFIGTIDSANAFAEAVDRVSTMTALDATTTSQLVSALDYFGLSADKTITIVGMAEKNLGLLTATQKKATDFQKTYGLALTDSNGKVKDFNTLLLTTADYYNNKAIPAQTKAAALSKIYGRNWQQLVEVFEKGAPAIKAAEAMAQSMGLTLTQDNLDSFLKLRDATREWNTALGGLQLQIGLAVMPALADLATGAAKFVSENRTGIVGGIKSAIQVAQSLGNTISTTILPAMKAVAGAVTSAWNAIPDPVRTLLIQAFIGNKVIKWTFGIDIAGSVEGAITKGLGGMFGSFLQKGGTPANPMFVADVTGGLGKGGVPVPGGGGGGISTLGKLGLIAEAAALAVAVKGVFDEQNTALNKQAAGVQAQTQAFATSASTADLKASLSGLLTQQDTLNHDLLGSVASTIFPQGKDQLNTSIQELTAELKRRGELKSGIGQFGAPVTSAAGTLGTFVTTAVLGPQKGINDLRTTISTGNATLRRLESKYAAAVAAGDTKTANKLKAAIDAEKATVAANIGKLRAQQASAHVADQIKLAAIAAKKWAVNVFDPVSVTVNTTVSAADVKRATTVRARFQGVHAIQAT